MLPHLSVATTQRQRQEDSQFKNNMGYTQRLYLKTKTNTHTHTHASYSQKHVRGEDGMKSWGWERSWKVRAR